MSMNRIGRALLSMIRSSPAMPLPQNESEGQLEEEVKSHQEAKTSREPRDGNDFASSNPARKSIQDSATKKQSKKEGQFRNPDHYFLATPAVVVHTNLTPGLGRRIPVDVEDAVMVHFVFEN